MGYCNNLWVNIQLFFRSGHHHLVFVVTQPLFVNKSINMKNVILFFLLTILFIPSCILDPCYNKDSFLSNLEKTVEEVKKEAQDYSDAEWEKKDKELEKLMDECYEKFKDELTKEERKQVFRNSTQYVYQRQKDQFKEFISALEEVEWEKEAEQLITMADEEIKEIFNDVLKDDLESFLDEAVNELENLAKDLREAWEEAKQEMKEN